MNKFFSRLLLILNEDGSKRERQIFVLLLAVVLSVLLWILVTLNQSYQLELEYNIAIEKVPEDLFLIQQQTQKVQVETRGPGVDLIVEAIRARRDTLFLPFKQSLKEGNKVPIGTYRSEIKNNFQENTMEILRLKPDYLEMVFEEKIFRRVPLRLNTTFNLRSGFQLDNTPTPQPEYVTIYGPPDRINDIPYWQTMNINTERVSTPTTITIPVDTQKGLEISPANVKVFLKPRLYTEKVLPFKVEVKNVPPGTHVRFNSDTLHVTFLLPLDDFESILGQYQNKKVELDFEDLDADFPHLIPELEVAGSVKELYRDPMVLSYVIVSE